jgi:glycine hydroxymethyltransferase
MHVVAAKAVAFREAATPAFRDYAHAVVANAAALADTLQEHGFELVSGGTDNHLLLVDLTNCGELTGKQAEAALERARITCNKNTVPGERRSPFVTSGIRLGSAALTSRGMGPAEMRRVGGWIADVLRAPDDAALAARISDEVRSLCDAFPVYAEFRREHAHTDG